MRRERRVWLMMVLLAGILAAAGSVSGCAGAKTPASSPSAQTPGGNGEVDENGSEDAVGNGDVSGSGDAAENENGEASEPDLAVPSISREEFPKLNGSTATIPISQALYRLSTGCSVEEAEAAVVHAKTTQAYLDLAAGYDTDLVIAYEPGEAADIYRDDLEIKPIGKDALVFMCNETNPVDSLTDAELVEIYSGRIANWSQVGGRNQGILAFQRPKGSGSQSLMDKLVMQGVPMTEDGPRDMRVGEMGELLDMLASYNNVSNALGYSVYYYARNMYETPGLKFMAVDGVLPDSRSIRDGSYPYVNEFYAAIRKDEPEDSKARLLFDWPTEDDGQRLIESLGYVALRGTDEAEPDDDRAEPGNRAEEENLAEAETEKRPETGNRQETEPAEETGAISLKENQKIIVSNTYFFGQAGITVMNEKLEPERVYDDMGLYDRLLVAEEDTPVMLRTAEGDGLYLFGEDRWLAEPVYVGFQEREDGFIGYLPDGHSMVDIGLDGTVTEHRGGSDGIEWEILPKEQQAVIRDEQGNELGRVDFADFGSGYEIAYWDHCYYKVSYENSGDVLLDIHGNLVFDESMLDEAYVSRRQSLGQGPDSPLYTLYVAIVAPDGRWLLFYLGEDAGIYNLEQGRTVTQPGDQVNVSFTDSGSFYVVTRDGQSTVYDSSSEPLRSREGKVFSLAANEDWFGWYENGAFHMEHRTDGDSFILDAEPEAGVFSAGGNFFSVTGEQGTDIYYRDVLVVENAVSWGEQNGFFVAFSEKNGPIIFRMDGEKYYESPYSEGMVYICGELLAVSRGNYCVIMDSQGREVKKYLLGAYVDD